MWRFKLGSAFWHGFLGTLVCAACIGVLLVCAHLWADHALLHQMLNYLTANAAKINKLPN